MTWNQPLCNDCWNAENPYRAAFRMGFAPAETCCMCGTQTTSGIYVRRDPKTVPHPRAED